MLLSETSNCLSPCIGHLAIESLKSLDLSCSSLNFNQLFKTLQNDMHITDLDISYNTFSGSSLQEMLEKNRILKVLNLTGSVGNGIAAAVINGLHKSFLSLKSLSIDLSITSYTFSQVEGNLFLHK